MAFMVQAFLYLAVSQVHLQLMNFLRPLSSYNLRTAIFSWRSSLVPLRNASRNVYYFDAVLMYECVSVTKVSVLSVNEFDSETV